VTSQELLLIAQTYFPRKEVFLRAPLLLVYSLTCWRHVHVSLDGMV